MLFNRDSNVTINGGYWDFGANTDATNDLYTSKILLPHLDGLPCGPSGGNGIGQGFIRSVGDVTDGWVRERNLNTLAVNADGFHV